MNCKRISDALVENSPKAWRDLWSQERAYNKLHNAEKVRVALRHLDELKQRLQTDILDKVVSLMMSLSDGDSTKRVSRAMDSVDNTITELAFTFHYQTSEKSTNHPPFEDPPLLDRLEYIANNMPTSERQQEILDLTTHGGYSELAWLIGGKMVRSIEHLISVVYDVSDPGQVTSLPYYDLLPDQ